MSIRARLKAALPAAIKAQETNTVSALRSMLAAIDNAEAVEIGPATGPAVGRSAESARKLLTEGQIRQILHKEAEGRRTAILAYRRLGRDEAAMLLEAELAVVIHYLHKPTVYD